MPYTRDNIELIGIIITALKHVHDPCTLEQLCDCKTLCKRPEKVKQCLEHMFDEGTVEHYGNEYMLAENVTDIIRHEWITKVSNQDANLSKRKLSASSYAEAVKRRESAPGMLVGACGYDALDKKVYKRSASDVFSGASTSTTQAPAVREDRPVVQPIINQHHHHHEHKTVINNHLVFVGPQFGPQYKDCDLSTTTNHVINPGDNANVQIGAQNQMNFQESGKGKRKARERSDYI